MNKVILIGRLTKDPDVRYTDGGTSIANFTLAVDRKFKRDGDPSADFIRCLAFSKTAEFIEKYFTKGMKLLVEDGRIQTGSYKNKEGQTVFTTEVVCNQVGFVESKNASKEEAKEEPETAADDGFMSIPDGVEDELPFL